MRTRMVTKRDIEQGGNILSAYMALKNSREPDDPRIRMLYEYPEVSNAYHEIKDEFGIGDHPSIIKAYLEAIIESDHPMLRAELKKIYMLGKLALDADNERLETAFETIRQIDADNTEITKHNDFEQKRYDTAVAIRKDQIEAARRQTTSWWDDYVETLEATINGTSNVWYKIVYDVLDSRDTKECVRLNLGGKKKLKRIDLSPMKSENWDSFIQLHRFAEKTNKAIEAAHRAFIDSERRTLIAELQQTREYKSDLKYLRQKYDQYNYFRSKTGMKRIKSPDGTWIYVTTYDDYDNPYESYERYDSYGNSYGLNKSFRDHMDEMHFAISKLDDRVRQRADEIIRERARAGHDGYDIIYDTPQEEKDEPDSYGYDRFKAY